MRGGVFEGLRKQFSTFRDKRQNAYCAKCLIECPQNSSKQEQPQPKQPETPPNENGWYYKTESFGSEPYQMIHNDGLFDAVGIKTIGVLPDKYSSIMNKLPDPSKEYNLNGTKYKVICDNSRHELEWQNMKDKAIYSFSVSNPPEIIIDGRAIKLTPS